MSYTKRSPNRRVAASLLLLLALLIGAAACSSDDETSTGGSPTSAADNGDATASTLRLGYFPNVTHAPAIVGVEEGFFADRARRQRQARADARSTPARTAVEALVRRRARHHASSGRTRPSTPTPSRTARRSGSSPARPRAARTSSSSPTSRRAEDLKGKTLATPQLGNTQDVALRTWLKDRASRPTRAGGGDVSIMPQENADDARPRSRPASIDGAWVPEPWATRLIQEGGGKVLVDESDAVARGPVRHHALIVRTEFLEEHPDVVKAAHRGPARGDRLHQERPRRGPEAVIDRHREDHRQAARRRR